MIEALNQRQKFDSPGKEILVFIGGADDNRVRALPNLRAVFCRFFDNLELELAITHG